ncbi:respiratory burst oxidase-like protein, putative [Medicago truncatula]|uniref:Respiratory burst oxidase-like protein, putative n=1 Tax=Medicago truncatula TaxID=3880 RepID=G7ZXB7_MEDTR|nr:respiratory burst oxidase-like protein, putative [Medicago truncatula]
MVNPDLLLIKRECPFVPPRVILPPQRSSIAASADLFIFCKRIRILTLWVCIMIGLFKWKFIQYTQRWGGAETLKFNMALILLHVCRNTITWLRSTKLSYVIPFDYKR